MRKKVKHELTRLYRSKSYPFPIFKNRVKVLMTIEARTSSTEKVWPTDPLKSLPYVGLAIDHTKLKSTTLEELNVTWNDLKKVQCENIWKALLNGEVELVGVPTQARPPRVSSRNR